MRWGWLVVWGMVSGCVSWRAMRRIDALAPFDGVPVAMGPAAWRDGRVDRRVCVSEAGGAWPNDREVMAVVLVDAVGEVCLRTPRDARCGGARRGWVESHAPAVVWSTPGRLCAREAVGWARVDDP
jgi:hypothetical protein